MKAVLTRMLLAGAVVLLAPGVVRAETPSQDASVGELAWPEAQLTSWQTDATEPRATAPTEEGARPLQGPLGVMQASVAAGGVTVLAATVTKLFFVGVLGGLAMSALGAMARGAGLNVQPEQMLGTMVGLPPGPGAFLTGLGMHLLISGTLAMAYLPVALFPKPPGSGIFAGAAMALLHATLAGPVLGLVPALNPRIPEQMPAPGMYMAGMGAQGVAFFYAEHLLYGLIIGLLM
ncbi:MAG: hypothetical protein AB2A00_29045 [Myxococcota bacterium]